MKSIVLLDRDGTINEEKHYLSSPDQLNLLPGAVEGIKNLRVLGLPVVVVTNQSAIARGFFDLETLDSIHRHLRELLAEAGTSIDEIYFCPHHPEEGCDCRKPAPGLAYRAAEDYRADLSRSFVIGDNAGDIGLGEQIGATTILVRTGYGTRVLEEGDVNPNYVIANLLEASNLIVRLIER